jgi:hypothetical protein
MDIVQEDEYKFLIISRAVLLRNSFVLDLSYREDLNTHILCSLTFFQKFYHLWDNVDYYCRVAQAAAGCVGLQIHAQVV